MHPVAGSKIRTSPYANNFKNNKSNTHIPSVSETPVPKTGQHRLTFLFQYGISVGTLESYMVGC